MNEAYGHLPAGAVTKYSVSIPAAGLAKFVKVVVYDYRGDRLGIATLTVNR